MRRNRTDLLGRYARRGDHNLTWSPRLRVGHLRLSLPFSLLLIGLADEGLHLFAGKQWSVGGPFDVWASEDKLVPTQTGVPLTDLVHTDHP